MEEFLLVLLGEKTFNSVNVSELVKSRTIKQLKAESAFSFLALFLLIVLENLPSLRCKNLSRVCLVCPSELKRRHLRCLLSTRRAYFGQDL